MESLIQYLPARKGFFHLEAELTARRSDVVAFLAAEGGLRSGCAQDFEEFILTRLVRAIPF